MSNPAFKFDHVHIISETPHASANWYVEMFGATIERDTVARGAPQIFVSLGGTTILIRGRRPGEEPLPTRPIRPYNDFSSHNAWGTDHFGFTYDGDLTAFCDTLQAKGVSLPVPLKKGVGGSLLCYVAAPDGVSIELMQYDVRDGDRLKILEGALPEPDRIDPRRTALIAYDVCRRALTPDDPARRAAMRPVLEAWMEIIAAARAVGVPVIYTTPVSRADGADVVLLQTDLSAETGVPPLTNGIEGTPGAGFPDEIAPLAADYVFLKRRPSAFYGTGIAELLHMLRRDAIIIGGGATNRGVETSVREAFNMDLATIVVRECCWSSDAAAHAYSLDKAMKMYARIRRLDQVAAMLRA